MDDWSFNFRSGLYASDSDSEIDCDDPDSTAALSADAQLISELDISARPDEAVYKPNPWAIARANAASRRGPESGGQEHSGKDVAGASKRRGGEGKPGMGALESAFEKQREKTNNIAPSILSSSRFRQPGHEELQAHKSASVSEPVFACSSDTTSLSSPPKLVNEAHIGNAPPAHKPTITTAPPFVSSASRPHKSSDRARAIEAAILASQVAPTEPNAYQDARSVRSPSPNTPFPIRLPTNSRITSLSHEENTPIATQVSTKIIPSAQNTVLSTTTAQTAEEPRLQNALRFQPCLSEPQSQALNSQALQEPAQISNTLAYKTVSPAEVLPPSRSPLHPSTLLSNLHTNSHSSSKPVEHATIASPFPRATEDLAIHTNNDFQTAPTKINPKIPAFDLLKPSQTHLPPSLSPRFATPAFTSVLHSREHPILASPELYPSTFESRTHDPCSTMPHWLAAAFSCALPPQHPSASPGVPSSQAIRSQQRQSPSLGHPSYLSSSRTHQVDHDRSGSTALTARRSETTGANDNLQARDRVRTPPSLPQRTTDTFAFSSSPTVVGLSSPPSASVRKRTYGSTFTRDEDRSPARPPPRRPSPTPVRTFRKLTRSPSPPFLGRREYPLVAAQLLPTRDPYAFVDADEDEEWSTLPMRGKKARSARADSGGTRGRGQSVMRSGRFRLPLAALGEDVGGVGGGKGRRIATYLPPPPQAAPLLEEDTSAAQWTLKRATRAVSPDSIREGRGDGTIREVHNR
jgi:hypothetical protein